MLGGFEMEADMISGDPELCGGSGVVSCMAVP